MMRLGNLWDKNENELSYITKEEISAIYDKRATEDRAEGIIGLDKAGFALALLEISQIVYPDSSDWNSSLVSKKN